MKKEEEQVSRQQCSVFSAQCSWTGKFSIVWQIKYSDTYLLGVILLKKKI